jgi:L-fuconate dehydratase
MEGRVTEFVDHLHEHFETPVVIRNARYLAPMEPGYSIEIKADSRIRHRFPDGAVWTEGA